MSADMHATPKRGTLRVIQYAECRNCGGQLVNDPVHTSGWVHDDTDDARCRKP